MKRNVTSAHKWNTADTITSARMAFSFFLLFFPLRSIGFFVFYTFTGLTDVMDGWLARKTGTASDFGARLDSIADLIFYGILLFRLIPFLWQTMPPAIWYAVAVILLVRLASYVTVAIKYRRFASLHTWLNKLTGAGVFMLPYVFAVSTGIVYGFALCAFAFVASLEELMIHLRLRDYRADIKSILQKN